MLEQDLAKFASIMVSIGELYDKPVSPAVIEIYWHALSNFSLTEIKQAIARHVKNPDSGKYLPKPADLIAAISGTAEDQALKAWSKVLKAIKRFGSYSSIAFDDPAIHAVIDDMGGWREICLTKTPFAAQSFQERYQHYAANKPVKYPSFLGSSNGSLPVLVGDRDQVNQVIMAGEKYES